MKINQNTLSHTWAVKDAIALTSLPQKLQTYEKRNRYTQT